MAGIGEVCSHVGALLFAVEAAVKIRNSKTVTEEKAYWLLPSSIAKVDYMTIQEINFTSAKTKKKQLDNAIEKAQPSSVIRQRKLPNAAAPTKNKLDSFFAALDATGQEPSILTLVPGYAANFQTKVLNVKYPYLINLFQESASSLPISDLQELANATFSDLKVTEEEARNCEFDTRNQAACKQWHSFRTGRITASRMKAVCRTPLEKPSKSLVREICYPLTRAFTSKATKWGCDHESVASQQYYEKMTQTHRNFHLQESGLFINPLYPYMGVSPDGIGQCDCCGTVVLEIKCPYCHRNSEVDDSLLLTNPGWKAAVEPQSSIL